MRKIHQRRLPFEAWPYKDRRHYVGAMRRGRRSAWKPHHDWSSVTCNTVMGGYALALGWLADNSLLDPSLSPAERWSLDLVERYLVSLEEVYAETTVVDRISAVERAISVLEPDADRSSLKLALRVLGKPRAKWIDASGLPTTPELIDAVTLPPTGTRS
jgi:hypothetical protein